MVPGPRATAVALTMAGNDATPASGSSPKDAASTGVHPHAASTIASRPNHGKAGPTQAQVPQKTKGKANPRRHFEKEDLGTSDPQACLLGSTTGEGQ